MYPYELFAGIDLYTVALAVAIISALAIFRFFSDRLNINAKLHNLCVINAVVSIIVGYFSAVLFQAFYNIGKYGEFRLNASTGATFYGGLIGGALTFILIYFVAGAMIFKDKKEHIKRFFDIADIAAISISVAHAFGRIGCLMAGCCHGSVTDKWYGIYMVALDARVVPIQLFEAIFLFALGIALALLLWRGKRGHLGYYMMIYGAWRFLIEYARDDYRGTTLVDFLTPSQLIAVLMIIGGAIFLLVQKRFSENDKAVLE